MKTNPSNPPATSHHQLFRRSLWRVLAAVLLFFGTVGCAHHRSTPDGKACGVGGGPGTMSCSGDFLRPAVSTSVNIPTPAPATKTIRITVYWDSPSGCKLLDGIVTVYLVKTTDPSKVAYCAYKKLKPQSTTDPYLQTLMIKVPLTGGQSTGYHRVWCSVRGRFNDSACTPLKPYSNCPTVLNCSYEDTSSYKQKE